MDSNCGEAYVSKSNCLLQLERNDEAIEICRKAIDINSRDNDYYAQVYINWGCAQLGNNNYLEAIGFLDKALEYKSSNQEIQTMIYTNYSNAMLIF
ncbi:MAG: tetratricopeptide repeat protein [Clostridiaceae bacterium]|nr:tetratricopeptide repeat protein [Clostridiaceae bacterium]